MSDSAIASSPVTGPDPEHERRTFAAVSRALRDIPFYAKSGRDARGLDPGRPLDEALRGVPLLFKKDIRATLPRQWVPTDRDVKAALASGAIELVETGGSTNERARVLWDRGWWGEQRARAMRTNANVAAAMASGNYREAVLTTPASGMRTCHVGDLPYEARVMDGHVLLLNMRPDPTFWTDAEMTRKLDELERHATVGLDADPVYLAILARYARKVGRSLAVRGFVQLAYGMAPHASLAAIDAACSAPTHRSYAARETGVLFVEGDDGRLHHVPLTTHVELLRARVPTPGAEDVALVVATTLDRESMPLVRYVVGDLVSVDSAAPPRFTTVAPLRSIEGRVEDALLRPDGALVTAGALDRALASTSGLWLYQANQRSPDRVDVDVVADGGPREGLVEEVRARLAPLLEGLELTVRTAAAIAPEPSGRFRTARRFLPLDYAHAFEGCEGFSS